MRPDARLLAGIGAITVLLAGSAQAANPLSLTDIHTMSRWVDCVEAIPALPAAPYYNQWVDWHAARASCGEPARTWDKDGVAPVTRADLDLAWLERHHHEPTEVRALICYADADETLVVPAALCPGAVCTSIAACTDQECARSTDVALDCSDTSAGAACVWLEPKRPARCPDAVCAAKPTRSSEQCADPDGNGRPAWLDAHLAASAGGATVCGAGASCGFSETCVADPVLGAATCRPRTCTGPCTAFHLEEVAADDVEVIVHLHYDYSPVPARVLDLHLTYPRDVLTLVDARPLPTLAAYGKAVATSHRSDGTLRLSVLETAGSDPVPFGPIVELVFQRIDKLATDGDDGPIAAPVVAFSTDDTLQRRALAPTQGAHQEALIDDALWGAPLTVTSDEHVTSRLRLWYDFEQANAPLAYANVPDAEALCARIPACALLTGADPTTVQDRERFLTRLAALQAGRVFGGAAIAGVSAGGLYLDGHSDHLRAPVLVEEPLSPSAQSFSFSTWFYAEGASPDEKQSTPQILYAHVSDTERTRFGLHLVPSASDADRFDLRFFEGNVLSHTLDETIIAEGLTRFVWHHVGITVNAATGRVERYFDGELRPGTVILSASTAAVACPRFSASTDVALHEEGTATGGHVPEVVYTAVREQNRWRIVRIDPLGLTRETVLSDSLVGFRDPDYLPFLDRLVFASNQTGAWEVYVSKGDGTDVVQLTDGFGDATLGFAARRPRWAPDGSAIVFDSAAFDVIRRDNHRGRVHHLYYLGWDPSENAPQITLPNGNTIAELSYRDRVADGAIALFRLTGSDPAHHHTDAHWMAGRDLATGRRGELLMAVSDADYGGGRVARLAIPSTLAGATTTAIPGLDHTLDVRLIAATHHETPAAPAPIVREKLLYTRSQTTTRAPDHFRLLPAATCPVVGASICLEITFQPGSYDSRCWDTDASNPTGDGDPDEDVNGDGQWTTADCHPSDVDEVLIGFDPAGATFVPEHTDREARVITLDVAGESRTYVQIIGAPDQGPPLTAGHVVGTVAFQVTGSGSYPFEQRETLEELLFKSLQPPTAPQAFQTANKFDRVIDGVFSPDATRLLLNTVSAGRPVLLQTDSTASASVAERVLAQPAALSGLSWVEEQRFLACNWLGGYQHPQHHTILQGFRGGLDDLKVHAGLRAEASFRSEAARGHEAIAAFPDQTAPTAGLPSCPNGSHLECPAFHLCVEGQCLMHACDPDDPYGCHGFGGRCTLRPAAVENEHTGAGGSTSAFDWVCAVDCASDTQCFQQQCLNGPCRFCDDHRFAATFTCVDCVQGPVVVDGVTRSGPVGCPDAQRFRCEAGACVSDCYAEVDEQSVYLCDPTNEYCEGGRCVLRDWDWYDLAPASFVGAGTARLDLDLLAGTDLWPGYATVLDQRVPIEIVAWGREDWGQSPELVVEVRGGPVYNGPGRWYRAGRVMVHHKTRAAAEAGPYVLTVPYAFTSLRIRQVISPYANLDGGANGLGAGDTDFCVADRLAIGATQAQAERFCTRTPNGSVLTRGVDFGAEIPTTDAIAACRQGGGFFCPTLVDDDYKWLLPGYRGVVISDVKVVGDSQWNHLIENRVCGWHSDDEPVTSASIQPRDPAGRPRRLAWGPTAHDLHDFPFQTEGVALLNCAFYDHALEDGAHIYFSGLLASGQVKALPQVVGAVTDSGEGEGCLIEITDEVSVPCHEWIGRGASLDPYNREPLSHGTLDFGVFRSFGHDDGFTPVPRQAYPLQVQVEGLIAAIDVTNAFDPQAPGNRLTLSLEFDGVFSAFGAFGNGVREGAGYDVRVASVSRPEMRCRVLDGRGTMGAGPATVQVRCGVPLTLTAEIVGLLVDDGEPEPGAAIPAPVVLRTTLRLDGADYVVHTTSRSSDSTFDLVTDLLPGASWAVSVVSAPAGYRCTVTQAATGTAPNDFGDLPTVGVSCVQVPQDPLRVQVFGAASEGVTLLERRSMRTLAIDAGTSGPVELGLVNRGDPFELIVTDSPDTPPQACNVTQNATGVMVADGVTATVTCQAVPTWTVTATIAGLSGDELDLRLTWGDGRRETRVVNAPMLGEAATVVFAAQLRQGDAYAVTITREPQAPSQHCTVVAGDGVVAGADPQDVAVICVPAPSADAHHVGGTIAGLMGQGLQLTLNDGDFVQPAAGHTDFVFTTQVLENRPYQVEVAQQPSNPTQRCRVTGGAGVMGLGDVDDVQVVCEDAATLLVTIKRPASTGATVVARLVPAQGGALPVTALAGVAPDDTKIDGGTAAFMIQQALAEPEPGTSVPAHVPPGNYVLYVFVNHDGDTDGDNLPRIEPGEYGAVRPITLTSTQNNVYAFDDTDADTDNDLVLLQPGWVTFSGQPDHMYTCWFASQGAILDIPVGPGSAVIATMTASTGTTPVWHLPGLPPAIYEVSCWHDQPLAGTSGGNGVVNAGELAQKTISIPAAGVSSAIPVP